MSESLLSALGIDLEELEWQDLSLCQNSDTEDFYDNYESDSNVAKMTDAMCLSCPVRSQCLEAGVVNGEWGVWGAVYLTSGKMDENKNSHKTEEVWEEIRAGIDG